MAEGGDITLTSDRLLLVEGKDEFNLSTEMLRQWEISGVQVVATGGKTKFKSKLEALLSQARSRDLRLSAIGIMRDADTSPQAAFQSVTTALQSANMPAPSSPNSFKQGDPSVGVFILPDAGTNGSVENLCWQSVNSTPIAGCVISYLECLQDSGILASRNTAKTLAHAYLAAQEDPSVRVGEGALKGYWPMDHAAFYPLKTFISCLASI